MLGGIEKRTILFTTVAACAALGIVAASLSGYRSTPLAPFIALATPSGWSRYAVWEQAVPMVAVLVAVLASCLLQFGSDVDNALDTICSGSPPATVGEWHMPVDQLFVASAR
jgi:hypothetical protein